MGKFLTHSMFYNWIRWKVPADGLIEEMTVEVEGGFDEFTIGAGGFECPVVGKYCRQ